MKDVSRKRLPEASGVYLFKDTRGRVIYIGKASNLRKRVSSYFSAKGWRGHYTNLREKIKDIDYIVTRSEMEALVLESNLIKQYRPRYNVRLKDDKKYPYLEISKEDFPRIRITRNPDEKSGWLYGPYTDVKSLRRVFKMLKEVFYLRGCSYDLNKKKFKRACLYYDLKQCSGPCRGDISREEYNKMVRQARLFLEGRNELLRREAELEMKKASSAQEYEKAAKWRDLLRAIEKVSEVQAVFSTRGGEGDFWALVQKGENACINLFMVRGGKVISRELFVLNAGFMSSPPQTLEEFLGQYYSTQSFIPPYIYTNIEIPQDSILRRYMVQKRRDISFSVPKKGQKRQLLDLGTKNANIRLEEESLKSPQETSQAIKELRELLNLPTLPHLVEGIDIAHIHGSEATGVVIVFEDGKAVPGRYRRFRIKMSPTKDDCAMISEIVGRRYSRVLRGEIQNPDLLLVDGGRGQVMSAARKLKELGLDRIPVVGIAKKFEHIYTAESGRAVAMPCEGAVLNLFKNVRDEAHRFAQRYHHLLHRKKIFL